MMSKGEMMILSCKKPTSPRNLASLIFATLSPNRLIQTKVSRKIRQAAIKTLLNGVRGID